MDTSLCLRGRHALHTMHAAFVLHDAINAFARHGADDFLITSDGSLAVAADSHLPAFHLEELGVHAEEVACKECCLVAACAAAYLEHNVLVVFGIGRNEQKFYFFFKLGDALFAFGEFFAQHFLRLGIFLDGEHFLCVSHVLQAADVFLSCFDDLAEVLVFLGQLDISLLICYDRRVGNECTDLLKAADESVELI